MRRLGLAGLALLVINISGQAQSPGATGPMSTWLRGAYQEYRDYLVRSAEKVPESMYGMRPGTQQEVRTFGQIPEGAKKLLDYLQSSTAKAAYKANGMVPVS